MPSISEVAVQIALEEEKQGVFETNNDNRGPRIDEYSLFANGTLGQAWCAKFAYWCFAQAALRLRAQNPFPKIFLANALEHWAEFNGKVVDSPTLEDVFVKESRHVGIARGVPLSNGTFPSVEGNTYNTAPDKRRDGVYSLTTEKVPHCTIVRLA